jgi:hypothetical protein
VDVRGDFEIMVCIRRRNHAVVFTFHSFLRQVRQETID